MGLDQLNGLIEADGLLFIKEFFGSNT